MLTFAHEEESFLHFRLPAGKIDCTNYKPMRQAKDSSVHVDTTNDAGGAMNEGDQGGYAQSCAAFTENTSISARVKLSFMSATHEIIVGPRKTAAAIG